MKVLLSPLDWGLGHTTRSIPVVRALLRAGASVTLAGSPSSLYIFREEFPELEFLEAPRYDIHYPSHGSEMPLWVMRNQKSFFHTIREEQEWVETMVIRRGFDRVISDNRFGFYSKKVPSAYITHQWRIAFPFPFRLWEPLGTLWHHQFMKNFSEVWVPDFEEYPGLAGKLSHVNSAQTHYFIGTLSRFSPPETPENQKEIDILAILSGPEPMRTQLEQKLKKILPQIPGNHEMILGCPGQKLPQEMQGNIRLYSHLETGKFTAAVARAKKVIARSGYSTIMDMLRFKADCIFVPTPGQTEQIYLAKLLQKENRAVYLSQKSLDVKTFRKALLSSHALECPGASGSDSLLERAVSRFIR